MNIVCLSCGVDCRLGVFSSVLVGCVSLVFMKLWGLDVVLIRLFEVFLWVLRLNWLSVMSVVCELWVIDMFLLCGELFFE